MLKDCLEIFNKNYQAKGEGYIIDSYILDSGSYILVDMKGNKITVLEVSKNEIDKTQDYYYEIAERDYLSKLIDMNKPVDPFKIIHSNNYLSFFIKKDNLSSGKLTDRVIDNYYEILLDPEKKYSNKKLAAFREAKNKYGDIDASKLGFIKHWIKENLYSIADGVNKDKNYLKIIFMEDIEIYKNESYKYLLPNIYNSADYNVGIEGKIYGVPNNNLGLNAKKPFLELKTRKNSVPYLIPLEEVLAQKSFFDYLYNQTNARKNNVYIDMNNDSIIALSDKDAFPEDFSGVFLRIGKGKEVEILDYDVLERYRNSLSGLSIDKVIPIDYNKEKKNEDLEYGDIKRLDKLKIIIDSVFFDRKLNINYFTESSDIKINDFRLKENLLRYRGAFFNWFYKGNYTIIKYAFPTLALELIKNSICNSTSTLNTNAKEQYNLKCSIENFFNKGDKSMADILAELAKGLRMKINSDTTATIESDREYYFAVGQASNYLLSLKKSKQKMHSLVNPILNCRSDEKLKDELRKLLVKYNYDINKDNKRVNNIISMVLGYIPEGKVDSNILVAGYLYSSLVYEKREKEQDKNE